VNDYQVYNLEATDLWIRALIPVSGAMTSSLACIWKTRVVANDSDSITEKADVS
jgi:hypothetical protein